MNDKIKNANQTTVAITGLGGALAVITMVVLDKFGITFEPVVTATLTSAIMVVLNFIIPKKEA